MHTHKRMVPALAVALALVLSVSACERDLTGVNENPNDPSNVTVPLMLPEAIRVPVETALGFGVNRNHTAVWSQQFAQIQYPDEDRYLVRETSMNGPWTTFYAGALEELQTIVEKGAAVGDPTYEAVGMIMSAWTTHFVTDLYGDVPFSEALQADAEDAKNSPAYDAQQSVYEGLFTMLETAGQKIDAGGAAFGSGDPAYTGDGSADLIYGGDMAKWQKFANSLRLRMAMRMSEVDAATAQTEFMEAYNTGELITSNADNAMLAYPGSPPNENPLFENRYRGARDDHSVSETLVDILEPTVDDDAIVVQRESGPDTVFTVAQRPIEGLDDPRLAVYAKPAESNGGYRGALNGAAQTNKRALASISRIGAAFRDDPSAPVTLMTAAEVHFLLAEAALRGWGVAGTAQEHYEAGITASLEQHGIGAGAIADYMDNPGVAYDAGGTMEAQLEQIITQKWIAVFPNGMEAWSDYRRTGYPMLIPGPDADNTEVPSRFRYPGVEQSINGDSWSAAVGGLDNGNTLFSHVWWDVN